MGAGLRISSRICVYKMPGTSGVLGTPRGTEGGLGPSGAVSGWVGGWEAGSIVEEGCEVQTQERCRTRERSARGGAGEGLLGKVTPRNGIRESQRRRGILLGLMRKLPAKRGPQPS